MPFKTCLNEIITVELHKLLPTNSLAHFHSRTHRTVMFCHKSVLQLQIRCWWNYWTALHNNWYSSLRSSWCICFTVTKSQHWNTREIERRVEVRTTTQALLLIRAARWQECPRPWPTLRRCTRLTSSPTSLPFGSSTFLIPCTTINKLRRAYLCLILVFCVYICLMLLVCIY